MLSTRTIALFGVLSILSACDSWERGRGPDDPRAVVNLVRSARVAPFYRGSEMLGLQITEIAEGSLFRQLAVQEGEIILASGGEPIRSPERASAFLHELSRAETVTLLLMDPQGTQRELFHAFAER